MIFLHYLPNTKIAKNFNDLVLMGFTTNSIKVAFVQLWIQKDELVEFKPVFEKLKDTDS